MADVPLMENPMTTAGDIIQGGVSGAPARLALGTAGQVLKVNSGATALEYDDETGGSGVTPENLSLGSLLGYQFPGALSTSNALAASRVYLARIAPNKDITVTAAYWKCATSSGNLDIGIYNEALNSKLGSTGSFASPGTGNRNQAFTSGIALSAGTAYYIAFVTDSTTLRVTTVVTHGEVNTGWNMLGHQSSAGFPLPSSITATWEASTNYPIFFVK